MLTANSFGFCACSIVPGKDISEPGERFWWRGLSDYVSGILSPQKAVLEPQLGFRAFAGERGIYYGTCGVLQQTFACVKC
jgi:hypothetical protein